MTQPPQDPQNPWENPGGGNPPQNPYGSQQPPDFEKPQSGAPSNPYGQGQEQPPQPPPYGGNYGGGQQGGGYGQQGGGYGPGGIPPYSGGQEQYGQASGAPMIASKWKRLVGIIIDGIIYGILSCCIALPFGGGASNDVMVERADGTTEYHFDKAFSGGQIAASLIGAVLAFLYFWWLTHKWNGQTLGKKAMSIRVVREDTGGPIDSKASAIRALLYVLLPYVCCIGGLVDAFWIFSNPRNQTLHDKIAKTVVVDAVGPNPYQH
ncbi:MAG: RDD family protein [Streptosporangiaceae bacterium]